MSVQADQQRISDALSAIRGAMNELSAESYKTSDPVALNRIAIANNLLYSWFSQLCHLQMVNDDTVFATAAGSMQQTVDTLKAQADSIGKLASDAKTAAEITGYITTFVTLVLAL